MRSHKRRGVALITALWVLTVLLVMVAGFAVMVRSDMAVTENFAGMAQARWAARAGIYRGQYEIEQLIAQPYTSFGGTAQLTLDSTDDTQQLADDTTYQTVIDDEAGKININTAPSEVLRLLFPEDVADAILDWRDADSSPEPEGAEDDYYTGLDTPYHCKNGKFSTVDELMLVKGVTREILDAPLIDGGVSLENLLTVSSVDSNTDMTGNARVNIQTASQDEITSAVGSTLTADEVTAIITQRTATPFKSPADLLNVPNLTRDKVAQIFDSFTTTTAQERPGLVNINTAPVEVLTVLPGMDDATAQAIVQYRTEQGPFETVGQLLNVEQVSNSIFQRIADLVTTRSHTFRLVSTGQVRNGLTQTTTCLLNVSTTGGATTSRILYWQE